jgi:hypothetical protein
MYDTPDALDSSVFDRIPEPAAIRERLGYILRESRLLRRLLPLAEKAAEERERRTRPEGGAQ